MWMSIAGPHVPRDVIYMVSERTATPSVDGRLSSAVLRGTLKVTPPYGFRASSPFMFPPSRGGARAILSLKYATMFSIMSGTQEPRLLIPPLYHALAVLHLER
ncbi:hypothetical protein LshimejAT787_0506740 [Lyophyllum shimeji]|uniref:Uncharacterized protein n=1 Tax=Lyophyllum shimeji TaxID=47721 RepID=A0A9P3PNR2_LYOSH|nr:hypothetical protein LshimejAT787_0506740 [Lyophyllum shimeji]